MTEIWTRDAHELADEVRAGRLRAADVLEVFLERIERFNGELNAFHYVDAPGARAQAAAIDRRVAAGEDPGPFAGVPMGVKELAAAQGMPNTHGSLLFAGEIAEVDDTEVSRLRAAGAVIVGKTTSPEFGSVNWTDTPIHGTTRNPWNPEVTPGGSSGGSAAAVAVGMMPICTGSDGGGSIRIPSSYSGLFGFKISFGLSGAGPEPFDQSLTAVPGPIARSVIDAARYVDVIAGPTNSDPTSLPKPSPSEPRLRDGSAVASLRGKRATWSSTLGHAVCDPEVEHITYDAAVRFAEAAGLELVDVPVELPNPARAWGILNAVATVTNYGVRAEGRWAELTPVVRAAFRYSERMTAEDLARALRRRNDMLAAIGRAFDEVDYVLTPTTATPPFAAAGPPPLEIAGRPVGGMGNVPYTAPFNMSGQPAVSIPAGLTETGLPVAFQVVGRRHDELGVLAAGMVAEQAMPWPKFAPMAHR